MANHESAAEALTSSASLDVVDAHLRAALVRSAIPGLAVAVLRDGRLLHNAAYGLASMELGVPATPATIFPIASVTKVFTAALVMRWVEAGRLGLDDAVGRHLRHLPEAWRGVTIRQLLSHTSGLPDVISNPMTGTWLAEDGGAALAAAAGLPLQFAPGQAWSYNQTNFVLLGLVVEDLASMPFAEHLVEVLLRPLNLEATVFGDARVIVAGRGPWYSRIDFSGAQPRPAKSVYPIWVPYPAFAQPCAGLNTTARDLATFVDALAAGRVLAPATVAAMWQRQSLADGAPAGMDPETGMGLGWIVEDLNGQEVVGGSGGASVAFRHAVAERATVAVLTNCQGANPDGLASEVLGLVLHGGRDVGSRH